jgi:hypothetical protein
MQTVKFPAVEEKLSSYLNEKRQFGYEVSYEMCQLKAINHERNWNPGLQHKLNMIAKTF